VALCVAAGVRTAAAQTDFPNVPIWSFPGAWHSGTGGDTISVRPRTITVRFLRDPVAEARADFAGYRIYRSTNVADTTSMVLLRRFTKQIGDSAFAWHFPKIDTNTPEAGRIATFIDPDSAGRFIKVRRPLSDPCRPQCYDSVMVLVPPPGPHNGFRTWYSITYEARNTTDNDYLDLSIPDTLDSFARCGSTHTDRDSCPNLNSKRANVSNDAWNATDDPSAPASQRFFSSPIEATTGPTQNLARVAVVPNPYRGVEAWNAPGGEEIHFINLPAQASIRIFTLAGDLVRELRHQDNIRDFEAWDLKNGAGRDVSSGIYVYRVEAGTFSFQNRFVVIR
jgi:hypothetical protein